MWFCVTLIRLEILVRVLRSCIFFFQAEDGIRDLVRSRGLGDVYKRQSRIDSASAIDFSRDHGSHPNTLTEWWYFNGHLNGCLLYTSDAADERSSVDLGGRRIIKKKTNYDTGQERRTHE